MLPDIEAIWVADCLQLLCHCVGCCKDSLRLRYIAIESLVIYNVRLSVRIGERREFHLRRARCDLLTATDIKFLVVM